MMYWKLLTCGGIQVNLYKKKKKKEFQFYGALENNG